MGTCRKVKDWAIDWYEELEPDYIPDGDSDHCCYCDCCDFCLRGIERNQNYDSDLEWWISYWMNYSKHLEEDKYMDDVSKMADVKAYGSKKYAKNQKAKKKYAKKEGIKKKEEGKICKEWV